jgi:rhomboid-like protein
MEGRWWTLLTSVFSHNMTLHIFINMFVLNSFGTLLEQVLGRRSFLTFYLTAGIVSSLAHAAVSAFIVGNPEIPALGASGAIAGLILVFSLVFPREKILLFGLIPLPAIWGALAFIALDLWGLSAQAHGGGLPIGHGAHLGGAFAGIVYYFFFIRPRMQRRRASPAYSSAD